MSLGTHPCKNCGGALVGALVVCPGGCPAPQDPASRMDRILEPTNFIRTPEQEEAAARRRQEAEAAERSAARSQRIRGASLPAWALEVLAAGGVQRTPVYEVVRQGLSYRPRIAVVSGPVGCGKTLSSICWAVEQDVPRVQFMLAAELADYGRNMKPLVPPSILLLDNVGSDYAHDWFLATLEGVLELRRNAGQMTILTTDLEGGDFSKRYGERLRSRILEDDGWIAVTGPDMRTK